jgi:hypothetical protein
MKIPEIMYNTDGNINSELFDDDWCLISNTITEDYFLDWTDIYKCDGSGYCTLKDIYTPIKIECITIRYDE